MNNIIFTILYWVIMLGLPIWFCIEIYLLVGEKYPEMRKDGWV